MFSWMYHLRGFTVANILSKYINIVLAEGYSKSRHSSHTLSPCSKRYKHTKQSKYVWSIKGTDTEFSLKLLTKAMPYQCGSGNGNE